MMGAKNTDQNQKRDRRRPGGRGERKESEFDQRVIEIARVTRVMAGGKRMRFRACVVIGDKKQRVGMALAKGADVSLAVNKAVARAQKHMIRVPMVNETIPHAVSYKFKAAHVLLKPAPQGSGVVAGGPTRAVVELVGIKNIVIKMLGSRNKINNVQATMEALKSLKDIKPQIHGTRTPQPEAK